MRPRFYLVLWLLVLVSLACNALLLSLIYAGTASADDVRAHLLEQVRTLELEPVPLKLDVHLDQTLPVSLVVPVDYELEVPLDLELPIDTTIVLPVTLPRSDRTVDIKVPVRGTVPVKGSLKVPVKMELPVSSKVPVKIDVPIEVPVDLAPFRDRVVQAAEQIDLLPPLGVRHEQP